MLATLIFHLTSPFRICENLSRSLYIFYKAKFTSCVNYYTKLSLQIFLFDSFLVKIHVFRVKSFDVLKNKSLTNKQKTPNFNI